MAARNKDQRWVWLAIRIVLVLAVGLFLFRNSYPLEARLSQDPRKMKLKVENRVELDEADLKESSGLARTRRKQKGFWSHNDSGDGPRLFYFTKKGKCLAELVLDVDRPTDWEDLCSFDVQGVSWLAIGDIGGNAAARERLSIHLLEEPKVDREEKGEKIRVRDKELVTLEVTIPGGATNYESLTYDPVGGHLILLEKAFWGGRWYEIPLSLEPGRHHVQAVESAFVPLPMATGASISEDGHRIAILTYPCIFLYERIRLPSGEWESWKSVFERPPYRDWTKDLQQAEAICFGADGDRLFVTSERSPTPLVEYSFELETSP